MTSATVSLGVAGSLGPALIARIAGSAERAGFHALWVNDTPDGDALAALAAAAAVTERLVLATGVVPLDRRAPSEISDAVSRIDAPDSRIRIGLGSGAARTGQLALVRDGVRRIRDRQAVGLVVGALGPRMRALAAREADGPLLSWLPPAVAAEQSRDAHDLAPAARVCLYVRAAVDAAGIERMREEAARYATYPNYAANFARLGVGVESTVLPAPGDDGIAAGLVPYLGAVDEVVLRAIPADDSPDAYARFIDAAAAAITAARDTAEQDAAARDTAARDAAEQAGA
ncbi:LLM class flavin-dependent oxidoreductase [Microbacterium sp. cx-59]|uniref:LLM class flavin-dependent oxidoreductase n=1 Tax=Microbacterium sp. cx-59 TaxID=2891207 RepID=UPI001E4E9C00|nr:LLM class flavin-dependent oxidoreductase [Microbacterium sp. cx-59]MCC4906708.1 LLM class flavin-dependent oxidoreductase [Microbacterium sp. cx-59]